MDTVKTSEQSVPHIHITTLAIPDGIPNDGLPIEDIVTVHVGLTVVYVTLATAGLVFAVVCLVFNLVFRGKQ